MKKLIENFDDMIWKGIKKIGDEELNKIEERFNIKFPFEDRKYLKVYSSGLGLNILMCIQDKEFYVNIIDYKFNGINNTEYYYKKLGEYLKERKIIPIISHTKNYNNKILENILIVYDFIEKNRKSEIKCIFFEMKNTANEKEVGNYILNPESIEEIKIGENLLDIVNYMYIVNKKIEKDTIGWVLEENSTNEEIEKFQEELGIKFPEKYIKLLEEAQKEGGVEIYPEKYKKEYKNKMSGKMEIIGDYMPLKEIKETYNVFLEYHKPYSKKLIPIISGFDGDWICLDYRDKNNKILKEPRITYYDTEKIGNTAYICIANSYDEFLNMKEIDKKEIKEQKQKIKNNIFYGLQPLEND